MAIKGIHVGPRSRVLEAEDAKNALLGAKVMGGLLPDPPEDEIAYPAIPGPSRPIAESLRSCGCGRQHIPHSDDPNEAVEVDGTVHRYSRPCYSVGPDGERVYHDFRTYRSVEARLTDLERVVADLVKRMG